MKKLAVAMLFTSLILSACGSAATASPSPAPPSATPPTTVPPTAVPASPTPVQTPGGPAAGSSCTNLASFVADVTVPDYSHFNSRDTFTKTWRVKNIGTCTWSAAYSASYASGDPLGGAASIQLSTTAPGQTLDISVKMTAPAADGRYKTIYQLDDAAGDSITVDDGSSIWAIITVGKLVLAAPPTAIPAPANPSGASGVTTGGCVIQANPAFVTQTVALINAARSANALPALSLSSQLAAAAQGHSLDMACNGSLSHTGSDGSNPAARIAASGFSASITRENIYAQPPQYGGNPNAAVDWWMNSQVHRDAILNAQVTQIGVGYAGYGPSPLGGYWTVDFAAP